MLGNPTVATVPPSLTARLRWSSRFNVSGCPANKLKLELQHADHPPGLSNTTSLLEQGDVDGEPLVCSRRRVEDEYT
jgi:hypothetical protein